MRRVVLLELSIDQHVWRLCTGFKNVKYTVKGSLEIFHAVNGLIIPDIVDKDLFNNSLEIQMPEKNGLFKYNYSDLMAKLSDKYFVFSDFKCQIIEIDLDNSNYKNVLFTGYVVSPKFNELSRTVTLICSTEDLSLSRQIQTRKCQKLCPNNIYDRHCGLDIDEYSFEATITSVNDRFLNFTISPTVLKDEQGAPILDENDEIQYVVKSYPYDFLDYGLLIKGNQYSTVAFGDNTSAKLYMPHVGLAVGDVVKFAAGCDQTHETCFVKFNNHARYGGNPNMPDENPTQSLIIK